MMAQQFRAYIVLAENPITVSKMHPSVTPALGHPNASQTPMFMYIA